MDDVISLVARGLPVGHNVWQETQWRELWHQRYCLIDHLGMNQVHPCEGTLDTWTNWAGVQTCRPARYFEARTEQDVLDVIRLAESNGAKLKVIGSGHSPSDIGCTDGYMVSLHKLDRILHVDPETSLVTVEAGVTLETLNERLATEHSLALTNLGSISAQSVAGAIATGTHGSGVNFGIIATCITALRIVSGGGQITTASASQNPEVFSAALCGLGALGVITQLTLQCVPKFNLRSVDEHTTFRKAVAQYAAIAASADHVRIHWFPHTDVALVNRSYRCQDAPTPSAASWFWFDLSRSIYLPPLHSFKNTNSAMFLRAGTLSSTTSSCRLRSCWPSPPQPSGPSSIACGPGSRQRPPL
eukprot:m.54708 g.54708  ORF g.54708 m.54708 type:complete len:359 (-) comp6614_c0_seq1:686-1762(-)